MHGDIIFLQKCTINEDHMMYGSWDIRYQGQSFVSFGDIFCLLTPLTTRKIEILIKWKKPGNMIILHLCATNGDDMVYGSWVIERDGQNFLSIWTISWHFTSAKNPRKSKFWKNEEQRLEISSFYTSVPKIMRLTNVIFIFHFDYFLHFYSPSSQKKQN